MGFILILWRFISVFIAFNYFWRRKVLFIEWEIVELNSSVIVITFLLDWISTIFIALVLLISSIVIFYRTYYIIGDKHFVRFIFLVYFFVLSMVLLILSPNIIRILLGWDGLGLVSYCLVIYYQNTKSASAGIITILSNRIGDVAILLRIAWILNFGDWNFFYCQFIYEENVLWLVIIMVLLAAITKRAQIPFSAWLPAAIAAPTPVSALVHSSTLVTAGVYLLIRFNYMLGLNNFLLYIGVFTMFISGLGANFETDLKKNYCFVYFKSTRANDNNSRIKYGRVFFFSFVDSCYIQISFIFMRGGVYSFYRGHTRYSSFRGANSKMPINFILFYYFFHGFMWVSFFIRVLLKGFYFRALLYQWG